MDARSGFLFGVVCDEKRFDDVVGDVVEATGIGGSAGLGGGGGGGGERWGEKREEGDKVVIIVSLKSNQLN